MTAVLSIGIALGESARETLAVAGWVVVHFAWQAAVVALGLRWLLARTHAPPRWRYAAAVATLIALAALPIATTASIVLGVVPGAGGAGDAASFARHGLPGGASGMAAELAATASRALAPLTPWLALSWATVAALLLVRLAGGWWTVSRFVVRRGRPARAEWRAACTATARHLGVRVVSALETDDTDVPIVVRHLRPVILLPARTLGQMGAREIEGVLAHELAHVRRRDYLANLAQSVVEAVFWIHPAVWWVSRLAREEREASCDDIALDTLGRSPASTLAYARALARLEALRAARPLALAASGGTLLRRVERVCLARAPHPAPGARELRAAVGAASVTLLALAAGARITLPAAVALTATIGGPLSGGPIYTVRASDPVGPFTLRVERTRVTGATVDGAVVSSARIVQRGDSVFLPYADGRTFAVRLHPNGGFTWMPRRP